MARIVPSYQALRHLARLCAAETPPSPSVSQSALFTTTTAAAAGIKLHPNTGTKIQTTKPRSRRQLSTSRPLSERPPPTPSSEEPPSKPSTATTIPDITTYYSLFPSTLPNGPPPSGAFTIPLTALRKEFLQLQSQHHPDKYSSSQTAHKKALALSALINAAYKTLSDPLLRAQYLLLNRHGIDVMSEDNSSHPTDQSTLLEVMEAQEGIEAAEGQDQIEALKEENSSRIRETEQKMGRALEADDSETAKNECVRLNYWRSLQDGLNDWEPGKEVRLIH